MKYMGIRLVSLSESINHGDEGLEATGLPHYLRETQGPGSNPGGSNPSRKPSRDLLLRGAPSPGPGEPPDPGAALILKLYIKAW